MTDRTSGTIESLLWADQTAMSPNVAKLRESLASPQFWKIFALADRIEAGNAASDDAEITAVYEDYPELVDLAIDAFNMLAGRDAYIAQLEAKIAELTHGEPADGGVLIFENADGTLGALTA